MVSFARAIDETSGIVLDFVQFVEEVVRAARKKGIAIVQSRKDETRVFNASSERNQLAITFNSFFNSI